MEIEKNYTDISTTDTYPKTLIIRNREGGRVWQVYLVQKESEADKLSNNAYLNGFYGITLEDYQIGEEETWPDWRETCNSNIII